MNARWPRSTESRLAAAMRETVADLRGGVLCERREVPGSQVLNQGKVMPGGENARSVDLRNIDAERSEQARVGFEQEWGLDIRLGHVQLIAFREVMVDVMPDVQDAGMVDWNELQHIHLLSCPAFHVFGPNDSAVDTERLLQIRFQFLFVEGTVLQVISRPQTESGREPLEQKSAVSAQMPTEAD